MIAIEEHTPLRAALLAEHDRENLVVIEPLLIVVGSNLRVRLFFRKPFGDEGV